jgi:transposase
MQMVTTIGLDIAKSVFQVHGVDAGGQVVIRRQLKRRSVLGARQGQFFAPSGRRARAERCPLSGRKRTSRTSVRQNPQAGGCSRQP